MKKVISILIILVLLFLGFEWGITFFKKGHEVSYQVFVDDKTFNVNEIYQKENEDIYDIRIEYGEITFSYIIKNSFNKQKKIIKEIEYFEEDDDVCIYPILEDGNGIYLECVKDNKLYTATSFPNQNLIFQVKTTLEEKGYQLSKLDNTNITEEYNGSTIYTNNLIHNDFITLWTYKGITILNNEQNTVINVLNFDKYENNQGYLVGNYYVIPNYLSSKVLEFSSVSIIDLNTKKSEKLDLGYTLSSNTYINGVVDNKLYYTDPSNLLQMEINPEKRNARLIGSKDLGAQIYNGSWESANIYDFVNSKILYKKEITDIGYSYVNIVESNFSYYFYNNSGEVYQVSKNNLDNSILLFKANDINNFYVVDSTIYYVSGDTLYYYNNKDGIISVLKNNDLRYNTTNRISVYRKS